MDDDFIKFKVDSEKKKKMETSTEVSAEKMANTVGALSEATKEVEPSDLGLTCIRCRRLLAPSQEGKHYKHSLKPSLSSNYLT